MTKRTAMDDLSEGARCRLRLTCLFGAFVFLQFTVLGLANHAGEGYLSTERRELVYYALQAFVILGYLLHALLVGRDTGRRVRDGAAYGVFGTLFVCVAVMLAGGRDSLADVVASMAAVLCVGGIGGAVHLQMSRASVTGGDIAWGMGMGSAAAVVAQYLLQIRWGTTPLLPVFMLAAFALLLFLLVRETSGFGSEKSSAFLARSERDASTAEAVVTKDAALPSVREGQRLGSREADEPLFAGSGMVAATAPVAPTSPRRIVSTVLIAATFILFACFYNEHIHHLMIQSDYASYTVYSWPRLMLVPGYLLFAAIGDRKGGKYVPIASLCIMLVALLNVVLVGSQGAYWLNMCLFYLAIAAFSSYYLLTFWRLAPGTKRPALWAPFGRMLDSGMVLLTGAIHLSELPAPVVLGMDIAGVALVIVVMALNGDFNLAEEAGATEEVDAAKEAEKTEDAEKAKATEGVDAAKKAEGAKEAVRALEDQESAPAGAPAGTAPVGVPTTAPAASALTPALTLEERISLVAGKYGLSEREGEVLAQLVLTEDKNQQIADRLGISRRQLQTHISHIYAKTEATTRAGLIRLVSDEARTG